MDVFGEKVLNPVSTGFYWTKNSEETAKRWEEVKGGIERKEAGKR